MSAACTRKILLIVNPNAGKRNTRKLLSEFELYQSDVDICISEYAGHCFEIARAEIHNYQTFIAAGGDGTVNEVASALLGSDRILAVYPSGSGNGFAHEFGFTKNANKLMKAIRQGKIIKTDVIQLNNKVSVHIAGVGFDSAVTLQFEKLKKHGFWNYMVSILQVIWDYQPIEATVEHENETISGHFFMINVTNTGQFGYNIRLLPEASPSDGYFELVLVSPFAKWLFPFFSFRLLVGLLKSSKHVKILSCKNDVILTTTENIFHIEGEQVEIESPVSIRMLAEKLNVIDSDQKNFRYPQTT